MINLNRTKSLLLVIDIQERLAKSMKQKAFESMFARTKILIEGCNTLKIPIIQSLQYKKGLGESVEHLFEEHINKIDLEKRAFSCCLEDNLFTHYLRKNAHINQIIIAGMEAHICVLQSARDLLSQKYEVVVVSDCVISRKNTNKKNALNLIMQSGGFVMNAESVLFDLLKTSQDSAFKTISMLIK